ncbi:MAG: hypothetical protein LBU04_08225 [Christensenellaceae bacterium]|jgi:hypothetical protein|nr:hypothetical protein [Christensenellaceae bacterium]
MWYDNLSILEKIYFYMALAASALLVVQTIMLFIGHGQVDSDSEMELDDADPGLRIFTVRSLVALFCITGWSGLVFASIDGFPVWLTIILSLILGGIASAITVFLFSWIIKMQEDGTLRHKDAVGGIGDVYMTIGANQSSTGKVMIMVSGRLSELEAITNDDKDLKFGEKIKVTGIVGSNLLLVSSIQKVNDENNVKSENINNNN